MHAERYGNSHVWSVFVPKNKLVVRLTAAVRDSVPWLASQKQRGPIDCGALVGPHGQLIIRPIGSMPVAWKRVASSVKKNAPAFGDERTRVFDVARLQAVSSLVHLSIEASNRVSIYPSMYLSEAGIGPKRGHHATVVAIGEVLEVWNSERWKAWLIGSGVIATELEEQAIDELGEDDG